MKTILHSYFIAILSMGLFFSSCQKEETEFIDETTEETITANSSLTDLLLRTTQNEGIADDIVDQNSCCSLNYPMEVIVNNQQLTLKSEADLQTVRDIYDLFPNDEDTLEIIYPINLIDEEYDLYSILNQNEMDSYSNACPGSNEILCLDLIYPIRFFTYNSNQQQTGSQTFNSDEELYIYLAALNNEDIISIDYPISIQLDNGSQESVNNNDDLQSAIESCETSGPTSCDEFEDKLLTGVWYISYFFDEYDLTESYSEYEFTFQSNNNIAASISGSIETGSWELLCDLPGLGMHFQDAGLLDKINGEFEIIEETESFIRLKFISAIDGTLDYLTLDRVPYSGGSNSELNDFIEIISTGNWYVNLFDDGVDGTCDYFEYVFTFDLDGSMSAVSSGNTVNGFWTAEVNGNDIELILSFDSSGGSLFGDLNDEWRILEATTELLRFEDASSGNPDKLSLGRFPADCGGGGGDPDPQELRDILISGTWYIGAYLDDGDDETADFDGYNFNFYSNETVTAFNGSKYVDGIWVVSLISDELNFEFDMDSPLNGADDSDYKVLQYSDTEVTFITKDSGGNIEDTLIFNKN